MKKQNEYSAKILAQLQGIFDASCPNYIPADELYISEDNATAFIHALSNIVPWYIYNKFTSENLTLLDFNHLANSLIFDAMENEELDVIGLEEETEKETEEKNK